MMQDCSEMWIDSEPEVKDYFLQQNMAQLEMNYKDRRIILPKTEGEVLEPIKVLRADIDYNKHLLLFTKQLMASSFPCL